MQSILRHGRIYAFVAVLVLSCGKSSDLSNQKLDQEEGSYDESVSSEMAKVSDGRTSMKTRTSAAKSAKSGGGAANPGSVLGGGGGSELSAVLNIGTGTSEKTATEIKTTSEVKSRMIIKNGDLTMEIEKYDECMVKLQKVTDSLGGFISDSKMDIPYSGVKRGNIEIRVPSEKFETAMIEFKNLAKKVEVEGVKGTDVSEEFFDLEARLINKQKAEARMQEILKAAKNVREIMEVERELTGIREDIERFEGRKRFLADQASLSTIRVTMHEPYPVSVSSSGGFWATIGDGFVHGVKGFAVILSGTIAFLIAGIPVFALIFLIVYLIVKLIKRARRKKIQVVTPPQL